jgi:transcriptional regulator with XRE-family HTH domain
MAKVSNAYLSQLERGLHEPSLRVMHSLADALDVSVEDLISRTGPEPDEERPPSSSVEAAIRRDPRLDAGQKQALLSVYRSYVGKGE